MNVKTRKEGLRNLTVFFGNAVDEVSRMRAIGISHMNGGFETDAGATTAAAAERRSEEPGSGPEKTAAATTGSGKTGRTTKPGRTRATTTA